MSDQAEHPLYEQPLSALLPRLHDGTLRASNLLSACEQRWRDLDPTLNAYKTWGGDHARRMAAAADAALAAGTRLGPLTGVPVSVKDHFGVHDLPIYAGTARELPAKFRSEGPVVGALREQLAVFTGKTHAVELAFGGIGTNAHWGAPRNPWDADNPRVSGGSSSGAGVSLQAGTAWLALGTDTGGSVRIPASMTGCAGFKTSAGRWSLAGIVPLSTTLDTAGILARSVADLAYGFAAIDPSFTSRTPLASAALPEQLRAGVDASRLRIGVADPLLWEHCQDDIVEVVKRALDELATAGAELVDVPLADEARAAVELLRSGSVVSAECDAFLEAELPAWRPLLDPSVTMRIADGGAIPAREYLLRQRHIDALAARADAALAAAGVDAIAAPTLPLTPPTQAEVATLDGYRPRNAASLSNTCIGNFLKLCGLSIPAGLDAQGLPVGLMLLARHGHDRQLLATGLALERVLGSSRQRLGRPPLC